MHAPRLLSVALAAVVLAPLAAQPLDEWAALAGDRYRITPDIVYSTANGYENRLDVYSLRDDEAGPRPTAIYIHGGGWVGGTKEASVLRLLPYLAKGMAVVNVEYRLARNSLAPAAVGDCRCALRWVHANAERVGDAVPVHDRRHPDRRYSHATRLHEALEGAGVANELVTVPAGRHGGFPANQVKRAYEAIDAFLRKHGVL